MSCIFCRIARREVPADIVWEDEHFVALNDLHPKAPVHVLLIPRQHVGTLHEATAEVLQAMLPAVVHLAGILGVRDRGYRTIINTGVEGGQEVPHVHVHILGGKPLGL